MNRNITLGTFVFSLSFAWFWLGIWIPYYLLFTNYAGIGVIETIVVLSAFLLELPTGAFADLIGKKKTLFIAFLFFTIGDIVMANTSHFYHLLFSVLLLGIGTSLYSGTRDAFLYDTLLTLKKENLYAQTLARIQKYGLIIMAIASVIGGWLYTINPSLPFWLVAVAHGMCGVLTLLFKEPAVDTEKFSIKIYFKQIKKGTEQLFSNKNNLSWIYSILVVGAFAKYLIEGIDPALALGFGVNELQLGYLYAVIPLISAAGAYWYEKKASSRTKSFWWKLVLVTLFIPPLLSPLFGVVLGVTGLLLRNIFYPILEIISSETINKDVDSKYRATTLSAFNMFQSLPYVLGAALVGMLIDSYGVKIIISIITIIFIVLYVLIQLNKKTTAR